jgi:hypothetical protein
MKEIDLIPSFNEFKKLLLEKKTDQEYSSGCLMGYFNTGFKDPKIKKEDIYDNDKNEYGLEIEPHVTILYGLTDDKIDEEEIIKLFTLIDGPTVSTDKITLFENDKFDVVKWDVVSDELIILNKMVSSMFPFKSDYPDYHAHVTIAYCLPGEGEKYTNELKKELTKKIDYWVYSKADGKKIKIIPGKGAEVIRETQTIKESIMTETELLSYRDTPKDESFEYLGYTVKLVPNDRFNHVYNCAVYLVDEYKMGIRGTVTLENAKEFAMRFIDNDIKNN